MQEMTSAKITRCNHYFHGVCLRKWLYVQDRCPFCHEIIMNQDPSATRNANAQPEPNGNDAAAAGAAAAEPAPAPAPDNADEPDALIDEDGIEALEEDVEL